MRSARQPEIMGREKLAGLIVWWAGPGSVVTGRPMASSIKRVRWTLDSLAPVMKKQPRGRQKTAKMPHFLAGD
jgi:hypothetical protein